ncbi:hypothetical protein CPB83DRAFT_226514 [Crepidotus variabilis]|uniref:Uncharacterized protein n=1 Tax=Crepidotus variabilis TaxID=179855 RepID=A0A9P6ETD8_9AGAR|nr:hypothetical protein CPB83DRAFT_226514 [Crepidotus variabilis]
MMQKNPRLADNALQDPRMIDVLGALMGIDIQASTRPEGSGDIPGGSSRDVPTPSSPPPPKPSSSKPEPTPAPPAEEDVEMDDEDAKAKKTAEAAKAAGGVAYKQREFDEAIKQATTIRPSKSARKPLRKVAQSEQTINWSQKLSAVSAHHIIRKETPFQPSNITKNLLPNIELPTFSINSEILNV